MYRVFKVAVLLLGASAAACREGSKFEPVPDTVQLVPEHADLIGGDTQRFVAIVTGGVEGVEWRVSGGTLVETEPGVAVWTAPDGRGTYTVTAVGRADTTVRATATVEVWDADQAYATDFAGYRGTAATLPAGMFVTGENTAGTAVDAGFDPFTGVHDLSAAEPATFDGFGAFTNGKGHYAFGVRERGETDLREARLFLAYRNESDRPIVTFKVRYDVEAWLLGERVNRIRLKFGLDTVGYSALPDLASTDNPRGAAPAGAAGSVVDGSLPENRVTVPETLDLTNLPDADGAPIGSLLPGETGYFRWQFSNADGDEGSLRSALAITKIRVIPIYADGQPDPPATTEPLYFSQPAGAYASPFELTLATRWPDATIYYTIDGSEPDPDRVIDDEAWAELPIGERTRTLVYDGPIDLAEALAGPAEIALIPTTVDDRSTWPWTEPAGEVRRVAVVRAAVVRGGERLAEATHTYLVGPESSPRTLPVLSIATERSGFFGREGIYVPGEPEPNFLQRGREWERPAHIELFEAGGRRALVQRVGMRIHGGYTRHAPKKSLRLYARGEYGAGRLRYRFFESKPIDDFNQILLRNSGQDWIDALLRDAALQTLVEHLGFETQHYSPVIVFLNGEYWGVHNVRDRLDERHLETHHGVPRDQVVVLSNRNRADVGEPADAAPFEAFLSEVRAGALVSRADFDERIDLDGYLDYVIAQMYAGNTDWPHNNIQWWRYKGAPDARRGPFDGRWRWIMFDVDRSFRVRPGGGGEDMVRHLFASEEEPWARELIRGIVAVPELRHELIQRIAVHLSTTFSANRVRRHIDSLAARIEPEIDAEFARWHAPRNRDHWEAHISEMLAFASNRPNRFRDHVVAYFDEVKGTAELEVAGLDGKGTVRLYSVPLEAGWPGVEIIGGTWRGELFTGVPVVLSGENLDLSRARISGDVEEVEITENTLRFVMTGPVRVKMR